jgi:hypothetical protein
MTKMTKIPFYADKQTAAAVEKIDIAEHDFIREKDPIKGQPKGQKIVYLEVKDLAVRDGGDYYAELQGVVKELKTLSQEKSHYELRVPYERITAQLNDLRSKFGKTRNFELIAPTVGFRTGLSREKFDKLFDITPDEVVKKGKVFYRKRTFVNAKHGDAFYDVTFDTVSVPIGALYLTYRNPGQNVDQLYKDFIASAKKRMADQLSNALVDKSTTARRRLRGLEPNDPFYSDDRIISDIQNRLDDKVASNLALLDFKNTFALLDCIHRGTFAFKITLLSQRILKDPKKLKALAGLDEEQIFFNPYIDEVARSGREKHIVEFHLTFDDLKDPQKRERRAKLKEILNTILSDWDVYFLSNIPTQNLKRLAESFRDLIDYIDKNPGHGAKNE